MIKLKDQNGATIYRPESAFENDFLKCAEIIGLVSRETRKKYVVSTVVEGAKPEKSRIYYL